MTKMTCRLVLVSIWGVVSACDSRPLSTDGSNEVTSEQPSAGDEMYPESGDGKPPQPVPFGSLFIAPNMDDDNENGAVDFYDGLSSTVDNEVYVVDLPSNLFANIGSAIGVSASGDFAGNLRVRYEGTELIGPNASPCIEIPTNAAALEVQMRKPAVFTTLTFHLLDANKESIESQSIRVASAPLLLNHHLQETEKVWITEMKYADWPVDLEAPVVQLNTFENVHAVTRLSARLGNRLVKVSSDQHDGDPWLQDEFEVASATASSANDRLDVILNSTRDNRLDGYVKRLAAPDTAVVEMTAESGDGSKNQNSFGNLEASPPVTANGVYYPFGRIYYGSEIDPAVKKFFKAQDVPGPNGFGMQKPFELFTSWLRIQHVDEVVTMVPDSTSPRGFRVLIASPILAYKIMEDMDPETELPIYDRPHSEVTGPMTVNALLQLPGMMEINKDFETLYIQPIQDVLKLELGLSDSDFYPVPVLFSGQEGTVAFTTNMVNLLVVNLPGEKPMVVVGDPFFRTDVGDRVNPEYKVQKPYYNPMNVGDLSTDPFVAAMKAALPADVDVEFVDSVVYHNTLGDMHCGTNSLRKPWEPGGKKWWQTVALPPLVPAPWTCGCQPTEYSDAPAFVGTPTPTSGGKIDWVALDGELATYRDPDNLAFTVAVPYNPGNGCGSIPFDLPVPCGSTGFTDYTVWRMGGAVATILVPPQLPQLANNWGYNPGYFADGMMDLSYNHPFKGDLVQCQGLGAGFCSIGTYGPGTDDAALLPSDLARQDISPGPMQPGAGAYGGKIRAFPVYQRPTPDTTLPPGYQVCYDRIDLHAQGGGIQGTCQTDSLNHGSIYLMFQAAEKLCPNP